MITPRRTRLVRVHSLHAYRRAIESVLHEGAAAADAVVVVPSQAAALQLHGDAQAATRDELYERLRARLPDPPRVLSPIERDVLAQASARAAADGVSVAFRLRPGLVAEMLRFYDHLRRQSQQIDRFEELLDQALGSDEIDRGARRMRQQTRMLAAAFREYERRVRADGACDEHVLRERLVADAAPRPIRQVVVTVGDWIAEPDGLFVADFDLLTRIPGLERLDIVTTEALLGSGLHERLHSWLPGLEEETDHSAGDRPMLIVPDDPARQDAAWWIRRDREEELIAIARIVKADRRNGDAVPLDRTAVVFKTPLPYLYLAGEVFGAAGIPYQTCDAMPLAAEPAAASLDLLLEAVATNFTRDSLVALLRSPHLFFETEGSAVSRESIAAIDRRLSDVRYLGDLSRLETLAAGWNDSLSKGVVEAALAAAQALRPLAERDRASNQIRRLLDFWTTHLRPIAEDDPLADRDRRARALLSELLSAQAVSHEAHDDPPWTIDDLAPAVRRAIEERTFEATRQRQGVHLLDDRAARYGDFDVVHIVGVVEPEWPERPRRNIFYPPALLKSLGWPSEKDRRAAADAHFIDLLALATARTYVSAFTLEDDALVMPSMQLDEIPRARLAAGTRPAAAADGVLTRIFVDEALSLDPVSLEPLGTAARTWAAMRMERTDPADEGFHGAVDRPLARTWSVSALETYVGCPFRFFAQHVLRLEEDPDDEEVMDPRRQGQFVHEVFERFFAAWQDAAHKEITAANLDAARALFAEVVERTLEALPEAEAGLERTRLLGSPAAAGLGEAVMRMEAERSTPVVERLLEHDLSGSFEFATAEGPRTIALRGKADRIDLLADGTFRVIDYKLGWPPDRRKALQLPIYSVCVAQRLRSHRGRSWTLGEAAYLAFKGPRRVVPLFQTDADRDRTLAEAQERLVASIDAIAAGRFPPTPDDVYRCETCSYSAVCRKDYVGDV